MQVEEEECLFPLPPLAFSNDSLRSMGKMEKLKRELVEKIKKSCKN